jgi:hypothetical protein
MGAKIEKPSPALIISKNELLVQFGEIIPVLDFLKLEKLKILEFKGMVQYPNAKYELISDFGFSDHSANFTSPIDVMQCIDQAQNDVEYVKQDIKLKDLNKFYYIKLLKSYSAIHKPMSLFLRVSSILMGLLFFTVSILFFIAYANVDESIPFEAIYFILAPILGLVFIYSGISGRIFLFYGDKLWLARIFIRNSVKSALKHND